MDKGYNDKTIASYENIKKRPTDNVYGTPTVQEHNRIFGANVMIEMDKETKIASDGGDTKYYELPPGATEIQDLIEYKKMSFSIGNIFKACYRLGEKQGNDLEYDIRKILWYANRELARIEREKKT
jgi:hypothetical protein